MSRNGLFSLAGLLLAAIAGCSSSETELGTVPVAGTVLLDSQPLAGASVYFMNELRTGQAVTDAEGRFELLQGAAPGPNRIYITKVVNESGTPVEEGIDLEQLKASQGLPPGPGLPKGFKEVVPPQYSDPFKTELTLDVPADGTDAADFTLIAN